MGRGNQVCCWTREELLPVSSLCFGAPWDPGLQGPGPGPVQRYRQASVRKSWHVLGVWRARVSSSWPSSRLWGSSRNSPDSLIP